ncbi:MAG TPA: hypothetical protein VFL13_08460 [Candidatus Baltobacteraceae bacterium]|nr:hypothetical protein [Candidatus Baltobacteraceae bacterium]
MVAIRTLLAAAMLALGTGAAFGMASAAPPPWAHARGHLNFQAQPSSAISGTIAGIDYSSASILVATPHGLVPVAITPSTSIYRGSAYASFADISRGAHVDINAADVGGRLVAQIVRIR